MIVSKRKNKVEIFTNGGSFADAITPTQQLRRSVMSTMLWEPNAYETGKDVADKISETVAKVSPKFASQTAIDARNDMYLRHVPLWVAAKMSTLSPKNIGKKKDFHPDWKEVGVSKYIEDTIAEVIQRPDEIGEFINLYQIMNGKKTPLASSAKRGLARAFNKFDAYQLGKWNTKSAKVKLRDALRIVHPKPDDNEKSTLFSKIMDDTLEVPETWEKQLSSGKNKKDVFENLLKTKKLGGLAFLRNLRNMLDSGVDVNLIKDRLENGSFKKVLPFTFISAYRVLTNSGNKYIIPSLEIAMKKSLQDIPKLSGKTALVIDLSGSMGGSISLKSELSGYDAASALAMLAKEICEDVVIFATAGSDGYGTHKTEKVKNVSGFKLTEELRLLANNLGYGGIFLVQCLEWIDKNHKEQYSRVIVFTDEQDTDRKANPSTAKKMGVHNYIVNISSNKNGIGYKHGWEHIDGFSERIFDYITESEK